MARRNDKRDRGDAGVPAAEYEGAEVLSALLARAGCPLTAGEVAERFAEAQAAGLDRSAAIPGLFRQEPRFASPDEARRTFQNLFGLWARVAAGGDWGGSGGGGGGGAGRTPGGATARGGRDGAGGAGRLRRTPWARQAAETPVLSQRGSTVGNRVQADTVEVVWQHLAALPGPELRRVRHRFESDQPDLVAWLAATELPESGAAAVVDLVLEAWAMLDRAFGDRLGSASWNDLKAFDREPPPLEADQPALAAYVAEQLDLLADEDATFGPAERAQVERTLATAVAALAMAVG